nr:MAG TPA: hypothetical protein [Caudoviricetes sp.]
MNAGKGIAWGEVRKSRREALRPRGAWEDLDRKKWIE